MADHHSKSIPLVMYLPVWFSHEMEAPFLNIASGFPEREYATHLLAKSCGEMQHIVSRSLMRVEFDADSLELVSARLENLNDTL